MFEGRDPSRKIVCEANRAFVVESGKIRPNIDFPTSEISGRKFKFQKRWYDEHAWLEYSVSILANVLVHTVFFRVPCSVNVHYSFNC